MELDRCPGHGFLQATTTRLVKVIRPAMWFLVGSAILVHVVMPGTGAVDSECYETSILVH